VAGGGEIGMNIGIVQDGMTMDGAIIPVIRHGKQDYLGIGDIVIQTTCGVVVLGILRIFILIILMNIGVVVIGVMIKVLVTAALM
jgi:hypothetical protein